MLIQISTDSNIEGSAELTGRVETVVEGALGRFGDRVTRVDVHLTDESSLAKSGDDDKRCVLEARLAGLHPIIVSHHAASLEQALDGAADKLEKTVDRTLEKRNNPKGRTSYGGGETI